MGMRLIVALLLVSSWAPLSHGQTRNFTQFDTDAVQCSTTEVVACSAGGTLTAGTFAATLVDESATPGVNENGITITTNDTRVVYAFESDAVNATSWQSGNWTVRINITAADADGQWDHTHICRVSSDCSTVHAVVGSLTNQNTATTPAGVKTHTVSGAAQASANASDLFLVVLTFQDTAAHGNMTVGITPNQNIDTPLASAAGPVPRFVITAN